MLTCSNSHRAQVAEPAFPVCSSMLCVFPQVGFLSPEECGTQVSFKLLGQNGGVVNY